MLCFPRLTPNPGLRHMLTKTVVLSGLLGGLLAAPVFADESADVSKLLRAGRLAEAITKADAFLAQRPRDAQMRFLKGVILTEQNKAAEAIVVFTKLTEDFPDLPEPYNNLAVLYASSGQYAKARAALDTAIRTNPAYATAYENLGDVHAKLASQAYDKALQLDSANSAAKSKLTLLHSLAGNMNAKAAAAPLPAAPKTPPPAAVVAQAPKAAPPAHAVVQPAAPAAAKPAKPAPAASVPASAAAAKPESAKPAHNDDADRDEVLSAVNGWAKAWSAQDVKSYLNHYGSDFQTPNGESRKAWAEDRHARIEGKSRIDVKLESPHVTISGNTATVKFRQVYTSNRLKVSSRKTLIMTKQGGKWQIKQERTGN